MSFFTRYGCSLLLLTTVVIVGGVSTGWAQTWDCKTEYGGIVHGTVTATLKDGTLTVSGEGEMSREGEMDCLGDTLSRNPYYRELIKTVIIENGVTSIEYGAFYSCIKLTSVTIPNSVTSIGNRAFAYCTNLTSITIPNSVTSIGPLAFYGCTNLTSVTIPNSVDSIGYSTFANCTGLTSITIPNSVTSIGSGAFFGCTGLTSITIPNSVTSIRGRELLLTPNGQESRGGAFYGCTGLISITIPNSVTSIGEWAFSGCTDLTSIDVAADNANYRSDNGVLINKTTNTLIVCPESKRGAYAIPNDVISIEDFAFAGCTRLSSVNIPNGLTSIGKRAFRGCASLTSIVIPKSVTNIGANAFSSCVALTSANIGAATVSDSAFLGCTDMTTLFFTDGVKSIGNNAFFGCTKIASVTSLNSKPPSISGLAFNVNRETCKLIVNEEDIGPYRAAWGWKDFTNIVEYVSIASHDRVIPQSTPSEAAVVIPVPVLTAEFTVGPNPAGKSNSSAAVNFFRQGAAIKSATLHVYDASGKVVSKVAIKDKAATGNSVKRPVGSWDLRDAKGRMVSGGTYLVKGILKTAGGKREKVSVVVGVK